MVQKNCVKQKIIIVVGPTASGKTKMGLELAKEFNGEIISADSMQVYKGMDVGTAKITKEEMGGIPHHLLSIVSPSEEYSVSLWKDAAEKLIEEITLRGKTPIIVGGTGLYITSLVKGYDFFEVQENKALRGKYEKLRDEKGSDAVYDELVKKNPKLALTIHPNKTKAIIRLLEILEENPNFEPKPAEEKYDYLLLGLDMDRAKLYERINQRVDIMVSGGLEEEVGNLIKVGAGRTSLGAIGYKEMISYFNGEISKNEAIDLIKQHSRNYAKRQLTYMRKMDKITWIKHDDIMGAKALVKEFLI